MLKRRKNSSHYFDNISLLNIFAATLSLFRKAEYSNTKYTMKKILILCCLFAALFAGCDDKSINPPINGHVTLHIEESGTLPVLIAESDKYKITSLKLIGNLNGDDIRYLREMAGSDVTGEETAGKLAVLDLSEANIISGGEAYYYDESSFYGTFNNSISAYMFTNCTRLTTITFPNSVTSIKKSAFESCTGLAVIAIGDGIASIDDKAFRNCAGLTSVAIGNSVTSIGYDAFYGCIGITSITIPNSVASIGNYAFSNCLKLKEFIVASGNNNYSTADGILFDKEKTRLISYPLGKEATNYTIPDGVITIAYRAFSNCTNLMSITTPKTLRVISDYIFSGCTGLTSVTIGNGISSIESGAFWGCTGLTSITIPNSVYAISDDAFEGCAGLEEIYSCNPMPPTIFFGFPAFLEVNKTNCIVYVPIGSLDAYRNAEGWRDFQNIVEKEM